MTNDPLYHQLLEQSWRRKLTDAEEAELRAWLAAHPEAQPDWDAEAGLSEALGALPNVPVATNFTARVLQSVERRTATDLRPARPRWRLWPRWLPRVAFAAILLGAGFVSYHAAQGARREKLVRSVEVVSQVSSLPSPQILENFDAIRALPPTPPADVQLLTLLQ